MNSDQPASDEHKNKHFERRMRPLHIAHVVTSLEPGGLENGVVNIANLLDPLRFRTSIICLEREGDFRERLSGDVGFTCLKKEPGFCFKTPLRIARKITEWEIDLVHSHNLGPLIYSSLAHLSALGRFRLVQGEHAGLREDEKTLKARAIRNWGYRLCSSVHTVSSELRNELIEFGFPKTKIQSIPNGVDCQRFQPSDLQLGRSIRTQIGINPDSFVVGVVGRFGLHKRQLELLEAFDRLAEACSELALLIVGDNGPMKEKVLNRIESSPYCDRIQWVGFQQDPLPFYRAMDLLVIPSENEGLSNAMLESMSCSVPCLVNMTCGAAEVIEDEKNGFLRRLGSVDDLENALGGVLRKRGVLKKVGADARAHVEMNFSLEAMISSYGRFYDNAAS